MPSVSKAQQTAMQIAEHTPGKLYSRNRGMLKLSKNQLHAFASGSEKGKPERKGKLYEAVRG
jgi:hypothetical protein